MRAAGRLAALAAALALGGCGFFGLFGDSAKKPMPLTDIQARVTPKVAWSLSVGKSGDFRFTPWVDGNRIFAAAAGGTISVVDAADGRAISRLETGRDLASGVAGQGDTVIAGTVKGEVVALDPAGKVRWTAPVGGEVLAPAAIAGKSAIVRTGDGRIFGLALADGKREWVYQRPVPALLLRSSTGVLATAANVVAGYPGGKLIALDAEDGKLVWEVTVSAPHGATELERVADVSLPVIDGGRICAAAFQGKVACFEIQGGNTVWSRDVSTASGLAADDRNVYLSDDQDQVHALDKATGAARWKQDKLLRRRLTAPVAVAGHVVVGDSLGYLHVLSKDDGAIEGRLSLDGGAIESLVPAAGGLVVQTAGGTLALVRF